MQFAVADVIVPLELHVGIEEPVEAEGDLVVDAAVDAVVVEVRVAVTDADLPGTGAERVAVAALSGNQSASSSSSAPSFGIGILHMACGQSVPHTRRSGRASNSARAIGVTLPQSLLVRADEIVD